MPRLSKVKKHKSKRKYTKKQRGGAGHIARTAARAARTAVKSSSATLGRRAGETVGKFVADAFVPGRTRPTSIMNAQPVGNKVNVIKTFVGNEVLNYLKANPHLAKSQLEKFNVAPHNGKVSPAARQILKALAPF